MMLFSRYPIIGTYFQPFDSNCSYVCGLALFDGASAKGVLRADIKIGMLV